MALEVRRTIASVGLLYLGVLDVVEPYVAYPVPNYRFH